MLGIGGDAPRRADVVGDRLPKLRQALRVLVFGKARATVAHLGLQDAPPFVGREGGRIGAADPEIEIEPAAVGADDGLRPHSARLDMRVVVIVVGALAADFGGMAACRHHPFGQVRADEGANIGTAFDVAFAEQLLIGENDGIARHAELFAQRSRSRYMVPAAQPVVEDHIPDLIEQLTLQRAGIAWIDRQDNLHPEPLPGPID